MTFKLEQSSLKIWISCIKTFALRFILEIKASNVVEKCSVENTFFKKILRRIFSKISKCSVQKPDAVVK